MTTKNPLIVKASINVGTVINQDFRSFTWPECMPSLSHYKDSGKMYEDKCLTPDMLFTCTRTTRGWNCTAPGFGDLGDYGNGSLLIMDITGINVLGDQDNVINLDTINISNVYTIQINTDPFTYLIQINHYTETLLQSYIAVNDKLVKVDAPEEIVAMARLQLIHDPINTVHVNALKGSPVTIFRSIDGYWIHTAGMTLPVRLNANHYNADAIAKGFPPLRGCSAIMQFIVANAWTSEYKMFI